MFAVIPLEQKSDELESLTKVDDLLSILAMRCSEHKSLTDQRTSASKNGLLVVVAIADRSHVREFFLIRSFSSYYQTFVDITLTQ
jgi:hypothetical protein